MSPAVMSTAESSAGLLPMNLRPVGVGVIVSIVLATYLAQNYGWRQGALFGVGLGAGIVLYHAAFGFTSAWRQVMQTGRSAGLRAQLIMLAVTALVFLPLIADGQLWGEGISGALTEEAFLAVLERAGFYGMSLV